MALKGHANFDTLYFGWKSSQGMMSVNGPSNTHAKVKPNSKQVSAVKFFGRVPGSDNILYSTLIIGKSPVYYMFSTCLG